MKKLIISLRLAAGNEMEPAQESFYLRNMKNGRLHLHSIALDLLATAVLVALHAASHRFKVCMFVQFFPCTQSTGW